ncbi:uncharacterized protein LOC114312789 [Camellia sinensis]|uniref:uncharacterized protein LOC114312789 n=1 Tax=Camellia sinensis TaxID=4442 RepID=UPI00103582E2|nr:uncharacterized protein LOC114312789 [Camellia sinensis]
MADLRWRIGDEHIVKIWGDRWLPRGHSFLPICPPLPHDTMVSFLLDSARKCWDLGKLQTHLLDVDVDVIRKIPISPCLPSDTLIWHYTRDGRFSVRLACHLQMNLSRIGSYPESSNRGEATRRFWKGVWHLKIPHKIKGFTWKACLNIIPTRDQLWQRRVPIELGCDCCDEAVETLMHCVKECDVAQQVWAASPLPFVTDIRVGYNFYHWVVEVAKQVDEAGLGLFFALCWGLWFARNQAIFNNVKRVATVIVQRVCAHLQEFCQRLLVLWRPLIVREAHGTVLAAMSERLPHWVDADCAEALAAASAIAFAAELGLYHIQLEGDSLSIIKAFHCEDQVLSTFGHILQGAVCTSRCFTSFCCSHVLRNGNKAAHGLARMAGHVTGKRVWRNEVPAELCRIIRAESV